MKVLAGELHETVYKSPEHKPGECKPLEIKSSTTFSMNEVTYISDDIGLHRVHNPSSDQIAVSLHRECTSKTPVQRDQSNHVIIFIVYTPPNAADYGYHIFDEATGSASHVPQARSYLKPQDI